MIHFGTLGRDIPAASTTADLGRAPMAWLAVDDVVAIDREHLRLRAFLPDGTVFVERGFGPFSGPVVPHRAGTTLVLVGRWHR